MSISQIFNEFGIRPKKFIRAIRNTYKFYKEYMLLKREMKSDIPFKITTLYPCLHDWDDAGGNASGHYFHQDLYVASRIFISNPINHIDIGSRVDGFVAHVASFRKVSIIDIRKMKTQNVNINYLQADMMDILPNDFIECADSVSCLHALEHFGLGRYGDPIKWDGHMQGYNNLKKMLKKEGILYLSVPIGNQRIEFNAHRVFSISYIIEMVSKDFQLLKFSYIDDNGDFFEDINFDDNQALKNYNCHYGCGIFELKKINNINE